MAPRPSRGPSTRTRSALNLVRVARRDGLGPAREEPSEQFPPVFSEDPRWAQANGGLGGRAVGWGPAPPVPRPADTPER